MIGEKTGIKAYVAPFQSQSDMPDVHYEEYQATPDSPLYTGNPNERYIEAITGQRFELGVIIPPAFDWKKNRFMEANFCLDDGAVEVTNNEAKPRKWKQVGEVKIGIYPSDRLLWRSSLSALSGRHRVVS
jgi:hypothetical protein